MSDNIDPKPSNVKKLFEPTHDAREAVSTEYLNGKIFHSLQGLALLLGADLGNIGYRLRHAKLFPEEIAEIENLLRDIDLNYVMTIRGILDGTDERFRPFVDGNSAARFRASTGALIK